MFTGVLDNGMIGLVAIAPWLILGIAVITDVGWRRIPNTLIAVALISGLIHASIMAGSTGFYGALGGCMVGLIVYLPLYLLGGMAAGDVKLLAALGAWVGWQSALWIGALSLIAGGAMGLVILLAAGGMGDFLRRYGRMFGLLMVSRRFSYEPAAPASAANIRFPFALALTCGYAAAFWLGRL